MEQVERAFSLSLAALLGENVYNFGELVRIMFRTQTMNVCGYYSTQNGTLACPLYITDTYSCGIPYMECTPCKEMHVPYATLKVEHMTKWGGFNIYKTSSFWMNHASYFRYSQTMHGGYTNIHVAV